MSRRSRRNDEAPAEENPRRGCGGWCPLMRTSCDLGARCLWRVRPARCRRAALCCPRRTCGAYPVNVLAHDLKYAARLIRSAREDGDARISLGCPGEVDLYVLPQRLYAANQAVNLEGPHAATNNLGHLRLSDSHPVSGLGLGEAAPLDQFLDADGNICLGTALLSVRIAYIGEHVAAPHVNSAIDALVRPVPQILTESLGAIFVSRAGAFPCPCWIGCFHSSPSLVFPSLADPSRLWRPSGEP